MGGEWYYWGTGGKSSRKGGRRGEEDKEAKGNVGLPSSCMCAVFQWFDFHHFQFATNNNNTIIHGQHQPPSPPHPPPFNPKSFLSEDSPFTSGVEAPRNSLELEDSSFLSIPNEVEHLDTHKQLSIQIKTSIGDHKRSSSTSKSLNRDQPSDPMNLSSPSSKTPNLVARLMGLDLLPDSPSSTSSLVSPQISHYHQRLTKTKQPQQTKPSDLSGTRSLPETPRVSSARRSDVDHRLSLQINKENISPCEELILSRVSSALRRKELNLIRKEEVEGKSGSSPRNLAKQIVKQVKESVSRRVGLDITNTISNRNKLDHQEYSRRESSVIDQGTRNSTEVRFLDINSKLSNKKHVLNDVSTFVPTKPKLQEEAKKSIKTIRLGGLRKKQEEPYVRPTKVVIRENVCIKNDQKKKCKRMALSNGLVSTMAPPTGVLPVRRDPTPPATKIPLRQASIGQETIQRPHSPSCSSPSYKLKEVTHMFHVPRDNVTATSAPGAEDGLVVRDYVAKVLKCNGLDRESQVSFTTWFSTSHPLNPTSFYCLEDYFNDIDTTTIQYSNLLSQRCNRMLLFQLVDEILIDMLRTCFNLRSWVVIPISNDDRLACLKGSDLVDHLCMRIRSYPSVDCRVLEDIDGLIDGDLLDRKDQRELAFEEEMEGIVGEAEKHVLDNLVHETAIVLYHSFKFRS